MADVGKKQFSCIVRAELCCFCIKQAESSRLKNAAFAIIFRAAYAVFVWASGLKHLFFRDYSTVNGKRATGRENRDGFAKNAKVKLEISTFICISRPSRPASPYLQTTSKLIQKA